MTSGMQNSRDLEAFRLKFKALQHIYCKPGAELLPGDAEASVMQYKDKRTAAAFKEEPALETICHLVKFGPLKEQVMKEWVKMKGLGVKGQRGTRRTIDKRASLMHNVLQGVCEKFSGKDLGLWIKNCGRFNAFWSGFVPGMLRLKILTYKKPFTNSKVEFLQLLLVCFVSPRGLLAPLACAMPVRCRKC
jgi:hypothetical protein